MSSRELESHINVEGVERPIDLSLYRDKKLPSPVIIKNCVATAFFGCRLDLEEIAWKYYAEFDPKSFAAAKLRLSEPQVTALIFASGKIVCTGAPSEESARVAVTKIFQIVNALHPIETVLMDLKIENIVGTAYLGYAISLQRAYEWMRNSGDVTVMYSPDLFPGMRFEAKKWLEKTTGNLETKVLAFDEGNVVITGGKNRKDLLDTWKMLRTLLRAFQRNDEVRSLSFSSHFSTSDFLTYLQELDRIEKNGRKKKRR